MRLKIRFESERQRSSTASTYCPLVMNVFRQRYGEDNARDPRRSWMKIGANWKLTYCAQTSASRSNWTVHSIWRGMMPIVEIAARTSCFRTTAISCCASSPGMLARIWMQYWTRYSVSCSTAQKCDAKCYFVGRQGRARHTPNRAVGDIVAHSMLGGLHHRYARI